MFETKEYKIEAEQKKGCRLELKVTATKESVQKSYKKAIKNINKEISIPGFRKGKVPEETVIKKFANQIEQEWKEILLNDALQAAFTLTKIYPLTKRSLNKPKIEKCSLEEGAVLFLSYEAYPKVPEIDFSSLSLPPEKIRAVTDEELKDVLEEIQESRAAWEVISDRPIEEGDYVDLSIDAIEDSESKPIAKNRRFQVKKKRMGEWMRDLLIGKNVHEVVEGESSADESASDEIKAKFRKTKVKITIHAIQKATLPAIDDELAVKVGAQNLEDLKEKIKQDLLSESEEEVKEGRFMQLKSLLLEKYNFDLPESLINDEKRERLQAKLEELKKQNLNEDELKKKEKELEKETLEEGERALRLYFLTQQIAKQGKISVSKEELNDELQRRVGVKRELPEDVVNRLSNAMFQRKIKEYALAQLQSS